MKPLIKERCPFREESTSQFEKAGGSEKRERSMGNISGRHMKRAYIIPQAIDHTGIAPTYMLSHLSLNMATSE